MDLGGLGVEGSEVEDTLEELPGADQVADADGDGQQESSSMSCC